MSFIDTCRKVVEEHSACCFSPHTGERLGDAFHDEGILLDAVTANWVCTVYDAINQKNKEKLESLDPLLIVDICHEVSRKRLG